MTNYFNLINKRIIIQIKVGPFSFLNSIWVKLIYSKEYLDLNQVLVNIWFISLF